MIATNSVPREALFKQSFFVCTTTVKITWWCHAWRICSTLATRVVPSAEGVTRTVQRAELANTGVGTCFPRGLKRCRLWGRCKDWRWKTSLVMAGVVVGLNRNLVGKFHFEVLLSQTGRFVDEFEFPDLFTQMANLFFVCVFGRTRGAGRVLGQRD